ncbi:MAG TPA: BTAD domain-containing putative transcriptional regulator, partial [Sphingomicrobium sp.]|nr:BTAD domain-containing putative transcriptional regulator [Sphingomicrobium sp.]
MRIDGPFALLDGTGHEISPLGRKSRAIIVYLIAHSDVRVPRERLITLLWGDRGQQQARDSFRQALAEIRRACGNLVSSNREQVWINGALIVRDSTPDAGELAEDLNHITPEFDDWLSSMRRQQADETWNKLHNEVEGLLDAGRGADAMSLIARMQNIDPYNEDWLRLAMRAEAQAGHPAGIQRVYRQMAERLQHELGVAPSAASRALHDDLIAELTGSGPAKLEPETAAETPRQDQSPANKQSAISRRVLVGGTLAGVAILGAGTSFRLGNGEASRPPAALEYYRRGIELRGQASLSQAEQSVAYLREATRIDPNFGEAWGALAWGYRSLLEYGPRPNPERTVLLARLAASRALEINPRDSQALAALLLLKPIYGNWGEIETGCRRLLKGDAAHSLVQFNLAMTLTEVG